LGEELKDESEDELNAQKKCGEELKDKFAAATSATDKKEVVRCFVTCMNKKRGYVRQ
jgi:hypothetical protein